MPWRFLFRLHLSCFILWTVSHQDYMAVITSVASSTLSVLPLLLSACFISVFSLLYRPTWIQMKFISIAGAVMCWQSVVSSSVCVCVCTDDDLRTVSMSCGCFLVMGSCWASPVHQSMSPLWVGVWEQPFPPLTHSLVPPSVSTCPPFSISLSNCSPSPFPLLSTHSKY